jgi:predicted nucleic acid-binding Zn ribbon protein
MTTSHSLRCDWCLVEFTAVNGYAQTCSARCRKALQRSRDRRDVLLAAAPYFLTNGTTNDSHLR